MQRKRSKRIHKRYPYKKIVSSIIIIVLIVIVANLTLSSLKIEKSISKSGPSAVIIDQLGQTLPNPDFVTKATSMLNSANYSVDYIPFSQVTIDFYKKLPTKNYDIIILRVHSTVGELSGKPVFLFFSSEDYDIHKYKYEQLTDKVGHVKMYENSKSYFGIFPSFVRNEMKGKFDDSIIIMMGCGGTIYPDMYESFLYKGASAYIGWDERVEIDHTDKATLNLLQHILLDNETLKKAIDKTNNEIGPDPKYNCNLWCYSKSE